MLTRKRLRECVCYNPATGIFTRVSQTSNRIKIGDQAGSIASNGYRHIHIDAQRYTAHRLAWFWTYGKWPKNDVDHINGNKDDNRIANLREASRSLNNHNSKASRRNKSGVKGVSWSKCRNGWVAKISNIYLGIFNTKEEAESIRIAAMRDKFGNVPLLSQ